MDSQQVNPMTSTRRRLLQTAGAAVLVFAWIVMGLGYHRMTEACYDSRHSIDGEPEVFPGAFGVALDVVSWPLAQADSAINGVDCKPLPAPTGR